MVRGAGREAQELRTRSGMHIIATIVLLLSVRNERCAQPEGYCYYHSGPGKEIKIARPDGRRGAQRKVRNERCITAAPMAPRAASWQFGFSPVFIVSGIPPPMAAGCRSAVNAGLNPNCQRAATHRLSNRKFSF